MMFITPGYTVHDMADENSVGKWAGIAGIAGPTIWWVVIVVLGVLWPEYDAVTNTVSELAAVGAPYAVVQQLNFYVLGASILVFAGGLLAWSDRGWRLLVGVPLLFVFGTGVIVAGFFQFDPNNLEAATSGYHDAASLVTFPVAVLGIAITSWGLRHDDGWPPYRHRFVPLGIALLAIGSFVVLILGLTSGPRGGGLRTAGWGGLGQRFFLLVLTGWVAYHARSLYRLSDGAQPPARSSKPENY
jgi:hypothetical membrane protein